MNILTIHNEILAQFKSLEKEIPKLKETLECLQSLGYRNTLIEQQMNSLENTIKTIENKEDYYYYVLEVTSIIEEYKKELSKPIEVSFMGEQIKPNTSYKDELTERFMNIAQKFTNRYHSNINSEVSMECDYCNEPMMEKVDGINIVCKSCGVQKDIPNITFSYKDVNRINITSRYTYDRRIHFKDSINQFQGKQNSTIADDVFEKLKRQFERHGLVDKKYSTSDKRRYSKVTKDHIYMFLKENDDSNHYEDANLIYHKITGKPLHDISYLEEKLMEDFDKLSELYDEIYIKNKKTTRKNFINTQYVLYQLLKRHNHPCDKNEFNFLKTTERKSYHDDIVSKLFSVLEFKFSPTF